jgi:hypothetical protein
MEFVQRSAGNAQMRRTLRLGAATSSISHFMLHRLALTAVLALALTLTASGAAQASDPLLSGYAGPGGGEQVVLGGTTVKPSGQGGSGASSSASAQDPAEASLAAPTTTTSSASGSGSSLTRKPQRKKSSSSASKDTGDDDDATSTTSTSGTAPATLPGAPAVVAYPTRAGEVGGLPISAGGLLLVVLGAGAATLLGLGLRRVAAAPRSDRDSDPQAPAV